MQTIWDTYGQFGAAFDGALQQACSLKDAAEKDLMEKNTDERKALIQALDVAVKQVESSIIDAQDVKAEIQEVLAH